MVEVVKTAPARIGPSRRHVFRRRYCRYRSPGKWPARAIICHLADSEVAFAFRLREVLAEPYHTLQPFDQGAWANSYSSIPAPAAGRLRVGLMPLLAPGR
jgi:hypothetical protein